MVVTRTSAPPALVFSFWFGFTRLTTNEAEGVGGAALEEELEEDELEDEEEEEEGERGRRSVALLTVP